MTTPSITVRQYINDFIRACSERYEMWEDPQTRAAIKSKGLQNLWIKCKYYGLIPQAAIIGLGIAHRLQPLWIQLANHIYH